MQWLRERKGKSGGATSMAGWSFDATLPTGLEAALAVHLTYISTGRASESPIEEEDELCEHINGKLGASASVEGTGKIGAKNGYLFWIAPLISKDAMHFTLVIQMHFTLVIQIDRCMLSMHVARWAQPNRLYLLSVSDCDMSFNI
jgi:hypothetical protein